MKIDMLLTEQGLRAFTERRRDQHLRDAREYGQIADILRRRIEQTPIDGDRALSARWRARRVYRQLRAMERASARAATAAESLFTVYRHQVLELPQRRELAAARKEKAQARRDASRQRRRAARRGAVARSLEQSTARFNGTYSGAGNDVQDAEVVAEYLEPTPLLRAVGDDAHAPARPTSVADFFPQNGGRNSRRGGAR